MNINIQIHYIGPIDSKTMQTGSFPVNSYKFRQNPDQEASEVAYKWWKLIKKDMSYMAKIEQITYNAENDITELVKKLDNAPIPDDNLPF